MGRSDRDPSTTGLGILAAGVGLCCGLPLLLGTGVVVGGAGWCWAAPCWWLWASGSAAGPCTADASAPTVI